jgi:hypothetical protein
VQIADTEFRPNRSLNGDSTPQLQYGCHCTDCHETHDYSTTFIFCKARLYRMSRNPTTDLAAEGSHGKGGRLFSSVAQNPPSICLNCCFSCTICSASQLFSFIVTQLVIWPFSTTCCSVKVQRRQQSKDMTLRGQPQQHARLLHRPHYHDNDDLWRTHTHTHTHMFNKITTTQLVSAR